jgi:ABC-type multidrug transport system ATPase subunit
MPAGDARRLPALTALSFSGAGNPAQPALASITKGLPMPADLLLQARDLTRSFGRRRVLRGVSFDLAPGQLAGIVGENGAGKSTLLKILAGELRPSGGSVALRGALGYCPQAVVLNGELTVEQHLHYFRAAYGLASLDRARELVARLGYEQYRKATVSTLSGGTKQKLNLTLALMHDPTVLLLDEPYQGFDWETYLRFWDLAAELRDQGRAVLVISHLVFDRSRFDQLYTLRDGLLQAGAVPIASR